MRAELDERWHVGFGVRCLIEGQGERELKLDEALARATTAAAAWGDVVPAATREDAVAQCRRRLAVAGLVEAESAA
jgi:ribonucleoside-diphosphate reductase beta chain